LIVCACKCLWDSHRVGRGYTVRGKHRVGMWLMLGRRRVVLSISLLLLWRGRWGSIRGRSRRWGDSKNRLNLCAGRVVVNPLFSSRAFFCKMALLFAHIAKQIWTALYQVARHVAQLASLLPKLVAWRGGTSFTLFCQVSVPVPLIS